MVNLSKKTATSKTDAGKSKAKAKPKVDAGKSKAKAKTKPTKTATKSKTKTTAKKAVKSVKKSKTKTKASTEVLAKPSKPRRLPLEKPVKGVLTNYQRGTVQQQSFYGLIQLEGVSTISDAAGYVGRSVILHYNERTANHGRIISLHGRNGVLRVRFKRGLAAEAIAKDVIVV